MKAIGIVKLKSHLDSYRVGELFWEILRLRQRCYEGVYSNALMVDKYDLLANQIILMTDSGKVFAHLRCIENSQLIESGVSHPLFASLQGNPYHENALKNFLETSPQSVTMSYLCMDKQYSSELNGMKVLDLMTYLALKLTSERIRLQIGYCSTPNCRYGFGPWLAQMGENQCNLGKFYHPTIPEEHELVLIPKVEKTFWSKKDLLFKNIWDGMEIIGAEEENGEKVNLSIAL